MTDAERKLWSVLRAKRFESVKFKRQAPVGVYIVDFVSFDSKIIIEVDGGQHNEDSIASYDQTRTEWLESQ